MISIKENSPKDFTSSKKVEICLKIKSTDSQKHPMSYLISLLSFEKKVRNSLKKSSETAVKWHVFPKIFGSKTSQKKMFLESIKHRVEEFFDGKSSTIMTYGTRDSGKTYTLFGTSTSPGIIMHSIYFMFWKIYFCSINLQSKPNHSNKERERVIQFLEDARILKWIDIPKLQNVYSSTDMIIKFLKTLYANEFPEKYLNGNITSQVYLSFVEIYNGIVYDLFDNTGRPLTLITNKKGQTYVHSSQINVRTASEACITLLTGQSRRKSSSVEPLEPSPSQSHTIVQITLLRAEHINNTSNKVIFSTLTFCDLAGSTRFKTHQKPSNMRDAIFINNDLLVLNKCLKTLGENQMAPFRESKLTRILQSALSGQENLSLIVNVAYTPNFDIKTKNFIVSFCGAIRKLMDIYEEPNKPDKCDQKLRRRKCSSSKACNDKVIPFIETAEKTTSTDYIDWEAFKNIHKQNEKLMKELATTKSDILNRECAIRKELADHYSRMIEEMEATCKKHTKEIEIERHNLLKWSVELVENFYKERIDNLMRHKKRKRGGGGDYVEDSRAFYEELELENAQVTSKMMVLKETTKELRDENKRIICKKNRCSFELALITKELKRFLQKFTRPKIRKRDSDTENDPHHLTSNLERLMYEKIRITEMELERINKYICATKDEDVETAAKTVKIVNEKSSRSENLLDLDTLLQMKKLEEELARKEVYIVTLKERTQLQEKQLVEVQQCLNDNMRNQKCKYDRSTNVSSHDYAVDNFSEHDDVSMSSTEKSFVRMSNMSSPVAGNSNDWIVVPKLFATHTDKKSSNISDVDRENFCKNNDSMNCDISRSSDRSNKDDSGVSSGLQNKSRRSVDNTRTRENESACLVEDLKEQNHEERLRVTELSENLETIRDVIYTLNEAACVNESKIIQHEYQLLCKEESQERSIPDEREIAIRRDAPSKTIEDKVQEYQCEIGHLIRKLIIKKENKDQTSECLDKYVERSKSLENKLSSMRNQLDGASDKCANEHLAWIESLEKEVLRKTLQINDLDERMIQMQRKFAKSYELLEKLHDFETIMKKYRRDKNELCRQLYECGDLKTQLILEDKLKELTKKIAERENKVILLKNEILNITNRNRSNNEKTRNLSEVIEASESIDSAKEDLQRGKDMRKNVENVTKMQVNFKSRSSGCKNNTTSQSKMCKTYDDSQDEIIRLKMQLEHKELEISRFKNDIDAMIQKYEILVKHLQDEIKKKDKQFKTIPNNLNNVEKSFTENTLSEIDSFYEFKLTANSEQSIESLKIDETDCSLTDSICLVSKPIDSKVLDVSSVSREDSPTFSNEIDGDSIIINDSRLNSTKY